MRCHVVSRGESAALHLVREELDARLAAGKFFWIDLHGASDAEIELLDEVLGLHPLAIEDSQHFEQRPKIDEYDDFSFLVLYGRSPDEDGLVEVHAYYSARFLVTVRRDAAPSIDELQRLYGDDEHDPREEGVFLLHQVVDGLVDSFFPTLTQFSDRMDLIEDELLLRPKDELLQDIFAMKRRLVRLRAVIAPQRDLLARITSGVAELPGMTAEAERHFRDVYDHLIRLTEEIDSYRDLMTASIDVYLSASSNRLNAVMKQLAAIATIFLPLTFVTGYFGQNFPWLVDHIGGPIWFLALGGAVQLAVLVGLVTYFKRKGWL